MKKKAEKVKQAEELKIQLASVSTVILSTFKGITVEQDTKLRRTVEERAMTPPVEGSSTSKVFPDCAGTHLPPISRFLGFAMKFVTLRSRSI